MNAFFRRSFFHKMTRERERERQRERERERERERQRERQREREGYLEFNHSLSQYFSYIDPSSRYKEKENRYEMEKKTYPNSPHPYLHKALTISN